MVLDRVSRTAYLARSKRSDEKLFRSWCAQMNYEPVMFDTVDHAGRPVYHTNMVLWIGTEIAGIGTNMLAENDRARILKRLSQSREVLEFDNAQIRAFCGNMIELRGLDDLPFLLMSEAAHGLLTSDQLSRLGRYYAKLLQAKIPTIETYGGGSARCLIQELF
jgi:hypothetical protein